MSEITVEEQAEPAKPPERNPWVSTATSISGLLIALGTLLGVCLHLTGHVAYITQLRQLGVPSDLFPHTVEWTMINGYYAVVQEWSRTLVNVPWKPLAIAGFLLTFAIWLYRLPAPKKRARWVERIPDWLRNVLAAFLMSGLSIAVIFYLLFVALLIAIVPGLIGENAGKRAAQETMKALTASNQTNSPDELWEQDQLLMRGKVIASSEQKIAFYDVQTTQIRILDIGEIELRTRPDAESERKRAE